MRARVSDPYLRGPAVEVEKNLAESLALFGCLVYSPRRHNATYTMLTMKNPSTILAEAAQAATVPCRHESVVDGRRSGYVPALTGRSAS